MPVRRKHLLDGPVGDAVTLGGPPVTGHDHPVGIPDGDHRRAMCHARRRLPTSPAAVYRHICPDTLQQLTEARPRITGRKQRQAHTPRDVTRSQELRLRVRPQPATPERLCSRLHERDTGSHRRRPCWDQACPNCLLSTLLDVVTNEIFRVLFEHFVNFVQQFIELGLDLFALLGRRGRGLFDFFLLALSWLAFLLLSLWHGYLP